MASPVVVEEEHSDDSGGREEQEESLLESGSVVSLDLSSTTSRPSTPSTSMSEKPAHAKLYVHATVLMHRHYKFNWYSRVVVSMFRSRIKRRATSVDVDAEILRQLTEANREANDEDYHFGQCIAASLKRLDPQK